MPQLQLTGLAQKTRPSRATPAPPSPPSPPTSRVSTSRAPTPSTRTRPRPPPAATRPPGGRSWPARSRAWPSCGRARSASSPCARTRASCATPSRAWPSSTPTTASSTSYRPRRPRGRSCSGSGGKRLGAAWGGAATTSSGWARGCPTRTRIRRPLMSEGGCGKWFAVEDRWGRTYAFSIELRRRLRYRAYLGMIKIQDEDSRSNQRASLNTRHAYSLHHR